VPEEKKIKEFAVERASFYPTLKSAATHLSQAKCTLTAQRLIISGGKGGIHQMSLGNISGLTTPYKLNAKTLRISLPGQMYELSCNDRDHKKTIEQWLSDAISGSFG
jgi:hypothetical protein